MGSSRVVQNTQIHQAFTTVDHDSGILTSAVIFVDMSLYNHCQFIVGHNDVATAITYTMLQSTQDNDGGSDSKAVNFTEFYSKEGTTDALLLAVGPWTRNTQSAANTMANTAGTASLLSVEFDAADLDADGGFRWLHAEISDPGATSLGWGLFILTEPRYPQQITPSAIT